MSAYALMSVIQQFVCVSRKQTLHILKENIYSH